MPDALIFALAAAAIGLSNLAVLALATRLNQKPRDRPPLPHIEPGAEQRDAAARLASLYQALRQQGFDDEQAREMITASLSRTAP